MINDDHNATQGNDIMTTLTINARTFDVPAIVKTLSAINDTHFTVANLARACALNEKTSRRKIRANASRAKADKLSMAKVVKSKNANEKYTFNLNEEEVTTMLHIIA